MFEKIKLSLRIKHNMLDADITNKIESCMLDMRRVGISETKAKSDSEDALICNAAEFYCKWQYDFNNKGDQFKQNYESLRDALSLCKDYAEGETADV